jgi:hypothetical protein
MKCKMMVLRDECAKHGWTIARWQDQVTIRDGMGAHVASFVDPMPADLGEAQRWIDSHYLSNVLTTASVCGDCGEVMIEAGAICGPCNYKRKSDLRGLAAREQPAPAATGSRPVWDEVIRRATGEDGFRNSMQDDAIALVYALALRVYRDDNRATAHSHVIDDMRARDRMGRERYGVPLTADNGRNHLVDAYQEALDLLVYLVAHEMAQEADHE